MSDQNGHVVIEAETLDRPPLPDPPKGTKMLEEWIEYTCINAMADAEKPTERVAAANAAIKFLAVRNKIGQVFGEGLDE